jgi:hypothetical protein
MLDDELGYHVDSAAMKMVSIFLIPSPAMFLCSAVRVLIVGGTTHTVDKAPGHYFSFKV